MHLARLTLYLRDNVLEPLRIRPQRSDRVAIVLAMPYAIAALALGLGAGLLEPSWPQPWEVLLLPPLLVLYPSLIEEAIFRGLLLPRSLASAPRRRPLRAVVTSTTLFVAMHPLNHWLVGLSDTSDFTDPVFLVIVTMLGLTCAFQRLRCASLWLPIATHWATVVAWNLFLGRDLALST